MAYDSKNVCTALAMLGAGAMLAHGCAMSLAEEDDVARAESSLRVSTAPPWCNGYGGSTPYVYASSSAYSLWNVENADDPSDGWVIESAPDAAIVENFDSYAHGTDITSLMPNVQVTSGTLVASTNGSHQRAYVDVPTAQGEQLRAIVKSRSSTQRWRRFGKMTTEARFIVSHVVESQDNPHVALMARYNTSYDSYFASLRFEKVNGSGAQRRIYVYVQRKLCGKYGFFGGASAKKYLDIDRNGNSLAVPSPHFTNGTPQTFTVRFTYDPAAVGQELKVYVNWLGQTAFNLEYGWSHPIATFGAGSLGLGGYDPVPTSGLLEAGVGGVRADHIRFHLDDLKLY